MNVFGFTLSHHQSTVCTLKNGYYLMFLEKPKRFLLLPILKCYLVEVDIGPKTIFFLEDTMKNVAPEIPLVSGSSHSYHDKRNHVLLEEISTKYNEKLNVILFALSK